MSILADGHAVSVFVLHDCVVCMPMLGLCGCQMIQVVILLIMPVVSYYCFDKLAAIKSRILLPNIILS